MYKSYQIYTINYNHTYIAHPVKRARITRSPREIMCTKYPPAPHAGSQRLQRTERQRPCWENRKKHHWENQLMEVNFCGKAFFMI